VIIDSAPIFAFANLVKANHEVKLDDTMARALFEDETYQFLASQLIDCLGYKRALPKHIQKRFQGAIEAEEFIVFKESLKVFFLAYVLLIIVKFLFSFLLCLRSCKLFVR